MKVSTENNNKNKKEQEITFREAFEFVSQRWGWFLLSVVICMGATWCYLELEHPVYYRASSLLIDEDKKDYSDNVFVLNDNGSGNKKQNKVHLLRSSELMTEVVAKLHLDVSYSEKRLFRMQDIYKSSPVTVTFLDEFTQPVQLQIIPSQTTCYLNVNGQYKSITYNDTVTTAAGRLIVTATPFLTPEWHERTVYISRSSLHLTAMNYRDGVSATVMDESTMYIVRFVSTSVQKADDILCALTEVYNHYNKRDKQKESYNTARFLEERILQISNELEKLSNGLTDVQKTKNIASLEASSSQYAAETGKIRDESIQLETNLSLAQYIAGYVTDATTKNELIPNVSGISEIGIDPQVQSYNNMLMQRNRLFDNSGENNSIVVRLEQSLSATRTTIAKTIYAYIEGLQIRLEKARNQEKTIQHNLITDPAVYDSYRQKKIKETLYTLLLQKQEENALKMSNGEPVAKMIERPYSYAKPTPDYPKYLIASLAVGLLIPYLVWWIIVLLDPKVRHRKDIEDALNVPVLGEIPAFHKKKKALQQQVLVGSSNSDAPLNESFRILSSQLVFQLKGSRVVMLTSSIAGEGKSFISNNLAATLKMLGMKVVLVDADIRKAIKDKKGCQEEERIGLSDYLSNKSLNWENLILRNEAAALPDILPAGTLMDNPVELLMNKRLETLMEELKKEYDMVIIDSVPAMGLADALITGRVADVVIYIVRERMLDRRILPELDKISQKGSLPRMHILLNDCQCLSKTFKGYYNYKRYYGYAYHYGESNIK